VSGAGVSRPDPKNRAHRYLLNFPKHIESDHGTLGGLSGSAPLAIGGGTVSDVFAESERAAAMALYTLGPLLGRYLLR
jgi:hypothetical protein